MLPPSGGGTRQLFIVFYRSLFAYVCRPGDGWGEALGASRETRETRREREISNVLICSIIIRRDAVHRFVFTQLARWAINSTADSSAFT